MSAALWTHSCKISRVIRHTCRRTEAFLFVINALKYTQIIHVLWTGPRLKISSVLSGRPGVACLAVLLAVLLGNSAYCAVWRYYKLSVLGGGRCGPSLSKHFHPVWLARSPECVRGYARSAENPARGKPSARKTQRAKNPAREKPSARDPAAPQRGGPTGLSPPSCIPSPVRGNLPAWHCHSRRMRKRGYNEIPWDRRRTFRSGLGSSTRGSFTGNATGFLACSHSRLSWLSAGVG